MRFLCILSLGGIIVLAGCVPAAPKQPIAAGDASSSASAAQTRDDFVQTKHGTAYAEVKGTRSFAMLSMAGETTIMHESDIIDPANDLWGYNYKNFRFSPSGRYVLFEAVGWEWMDGFVFDTQTKTLLSPPIATPHTFAVTPDEQRLFSCAHNEFGGEFHGKVYALPDGRELVNVIPKEGFPTGSGTYITDIQCAMSGVNVEFTLSEGRYGPTGDVVTATHRIVVDPSDGRIITR